MSRKEWFRLDTAALIFPAIRHHNWNNVFRLSAEMADEVDPDALNRAAADLARRFPTFFVRLRKGFFWYYLEKLEKPAPALRDFAYPLTYMPAKELRKSCIRLFYHENRIAMELFHSVSDGGGASVFFKNLLVRYIFYKYGVVTPPQGDIADIEAKPSPEELEDGFYRFAGPKPMGRNEENSYRLTGTHDDTGFKHLVTGILPTDELIKKSHEYGATVTAFLSGVMAESIMKLQRRRVPEKMQKPVKITIAANLRHIFPTKTMRNFVLAVNPGFDPGYGSYSLEDIVRIISHQLAVDLMPQTMSGRIMTNVAPQRNPVVRLMPRFIKDMAMSMVYFSVGERKGSINISNLGQMTLDESAAAYVKRIEFIIGEQYTYPNNCAVASYGGRTYINMIRNIRETELERIFFSRLVSLGIPVEIETNERE